MPQQESKAAPRDRFLISRFAWIQARRVGNLAWFQWSSVEFVRNFRPKSSHPYFFVYNCTAVAELETSGKYSGSYFKKTP
jgi:hypothetical protein